MSTKAMSKAEAHELANTAGTPLAPLLNELVERTFRKAAPKKASKKKADKESADESAVAGKDQK